MSTLPPLQILTILVGKIQPIGFFQNDLVEKFNGQPPLVIGSLGRGKAELP